jgi:hypothetical protein
MSSSSMLRRGWPWFGAWALAGALCSFAILSAASIGLFVFPFALVAFWLLWRRGASSAEMLGSIAGAGAPCLLVAALAAGNEAPNARPWLGAGLVLVAIGIGAYTLVRRRPEPPSAIV